MPSLVRPQFLSRSRSTPTSSPRFPLAALGWLKVALLEARCTSITPRIAEPAASTDGATQARAYLEALRSPLAVNYAICLDLIGANRVPSTEKIRALDLCSGPGLFSALLGEYASEVVGLDFSPDMLKVAREHAGRNHPAKTATGALRFCEGDATNLVGLSSDSFDLVTFMDAAHHLQDLDAVAAAISECDRVCAAEGTVLMMDLRRLKHPDSAAALHRVLGPFEHPQFSEDTLHSLRAAWTAEELAGAVRSGTGHKHDWYQLEAPGSVPLQAVLGVPAGTAPRLSTPGLSAIWRHVPGALRAEAFLVRAALRVGGFKRI